MEVVKNFLYKNTTSSLNERKDLFNALFEVLEAKEDVKDELVKVIIKSLFVTLSLYDDLKSRRLCTKLISLLLAKNKSATETVLLNCLEKVASSQVQGKSVCRSESAKSLAAMDWAIIALKKLYLSENKTDGSNYKRWILVQSNLMYGIIAAGYKPITRSGHRKLISILKNNTEVTDSYVATLLPEASLSSIAFTSSVISIDKEAFARRQDVLSGFVKGVIMSRTAPSAQCLESYKPTLVQITHESFLQVIVPGMQKALLRSPENCLDTVGKILASLKIDLSRHVGVLMKMLAAQLVSKNELNAERASVCIASLAKQCSDSGAVQEAVDFLVAVLKGSEGKLTLAKQKVLVLSCVGSFAFSPIGSGGKVPVELLEHVSDHLIALFQQEPNEGVLVGGYLALAKWCAKLKGQVPTSLLDWFGKVPTTKSHNPTVRVAYLSCLLQAFKNDSLPQLEKSIPYLVQAVAKGAQQALQVLPVTEALHAACLLSNLRNVEFAKPVDYGSFWTNALDRKKMLFTSHKFLTNASDDTLLVLVQFAYNLLSLHCDKLNHETTRMYIKAMLYVGLNKAWPLRQSVEKAFKKLVASIGGADICYLLMDEFFIHLHQYRVPDDCEQPHEGAGESSSGRISSRDFTRLLLAIVSIRDVDLATEGGKSLAFMLLRNSYHPLLAETNDHLWRDFIASSCNCKVQDFIDQNHKTILEQLVHNETSTKASLAALTGVVSIGADTLMPSIVEALRAQLDLIGREKITNDEISIMKTPPGELWNVNVIKSAPEVVANKNVKRESKAYSFQEQKLEEELRREMGKKKKGGKGDGTGGGGNKKSNGGKLTEGLTKKQRELVEFELERESKIRERVTKFETVMARAHDTLMAICSSSDSLNNRFSNLYVGLMEPLLDLLAAPIASHRIQQVLISLCNVFAICEQEHSLLTKLMYATMRMYKPVARVDEAWCSQPLEPLVTRVIERLLTNTDATRGSAFFAFIFPFARSALACPLLDENEELLTSLMTYAHRHLSEDAIAAPLYDVAALPRLSVMRTACRLMSQGMGEQLHDGALQLLLATCRVSTGVDDPRVASLSEEELQVLLHALQSPVAYLRLAACKGLEVVAGATRKLMEESRETMDQVSVRIWIACHDDFDEVQTLAADVWMLLSLETKADLCSKLLQDVEHHEPVIQQAAARAIGSACKDFPDISSVLVNHLIELFQAKLERAPVEMDALGRVISEPQPDDYQSRIGVALVFKTIVPLIQPSSLTMLFKFFVPQALGDEHEEVRSSILAAAVACVDFHGRANSNPLFDILDDFLQNAPNSAKYDVVRQSVVILLGTLARHLDKNDSKVRPIVVKLVETLSTPSQAVQESVANCLPALVPSIRDDAGVLVKKLIAILLTSESFGERKGAAYGLAGMVKGLGIISFKQMEIITQLNEAVQDKKNFKYREGALLAYEMFCRMLGRLFEPYVKQILPHLLFCFGDGNQYVRMAANNTAKAIMQNLSSHGVRLVLPTLLEAIHTDDSWRTKTGSAELLGAMAHCAPKQLSSCLPNIVPKLCEVLTDSHAKVQEAGRQALSQIASVIRNPEVQAISPILHKALCDPTKHNEACLEKLLNTKFIHKIDSPSLALMLPVIIRAFNSRATTSRKMAAQIIGNMYSLTEQKDLEPYLDDIIPGLKTTLLDPVPEVRGHAAKALGAMVKGSSEKSFEPLFSWLMNTLTSEQSSVDRSGAAQGLSETLASLGAERLRTLMNQVIELAGKTEVAAHVRDGYIMLFIYLPSTFGDKFVPYIGDVIMPILKALADENEFLRSTAIRAGQRIIQQFAETAIEFLLPQLETGLFDDNWRIRLSSVQLLGDLLFHLSGVTGKMSATGGEDENFGTNENFQEIAKTLGLERRNFALSGLYICRGDTALRVRNSAMHVWKIIVPNTPRLLREILPTLLTCLIKNLASANADKRQVAARTLGDVVRKLSDRILPDLIPILEKNLDSEDESQRQGVCIGLSEIINACSKDAISVFTENLVPAVRKALCDPLPDVRMAASKTFEELHNAIGLQALDGVLPSLLKELVTKTGVEQQNVVDGLKQIISVKGKYVLPFIIPKLLEDPVDTEILALLSSVAGEALTRHLPNILKALQTSLSKVMNEGLLFEKVLDDASLVVLSVEDDHGHRIIMDDLIVAIKSKELGIRYAAISLLQAMVEKGTMDNSDYFSIFIHDFIRLLADSDERVQRCAWMALSSVTSSIEVSDMQPFISSIRHAFRTVKNEPNTVENGGVVPGFCLPKLGLTPLLPILRDGVLNGAADIKESAARCLCEGIVLLTPQALKHSVVAITGPLIRILGDRYGPNVRCAVIDAISLLLERVGLFLKPFMPQLLTTCGKALQDTSRLVRLRAANALHHLCRVHNKVDAVFLDIHTNLVSNEDIQYKETYLQAMRGCVSTGGKKLGEKLRGEMVETLCDLMSNCEEESVVCAAAGCLAALLTYVDQQQLDHIFGSYIKNCSEDSWSARLGRSSLVAIAIKESYQRLCANPQYKEKMIALLTTFVASDRVQIASMGVKGCGFAILNNIIHDDSQIEPSVISALAKGLDHSSNDVKNDTTRVITWINYQLQHVHKSTPDKQIPFEVSKQVLSSLLLLSRERAVTLRAGAESALMALFQVRTSSNALIEQYVNANGGGRDCNALQECYTQKLKRSESSQEVCEEIDNTTFWN